MHKRQFVSRSTLLPLGCVLGTLLFATPAAASLATGTEGDGVLSLLNFDVCFGERPNVDCDVTLPVPIDQVEAAKDDGAPTKPEAPRKVELLGMTMCLGGSAADCDIELPWQNA